MLLNARIQDIPRMRRSKNSFMLNSVLLMLLVSRVACLPAKPEPDGDKHEVDVTDSGQRAEVHNRELNRSGWAIADAPALPDVQDKEEKYKRNRRRKSTSNNFGPGYGWKSDIVHRTSFGKEVSGDNIVDKGQTLMLLDRETDASGEKKTAVEVQLWQYIGLPIGFAIVIAACAWLTRWWKRRRGYEPMGGGNYQDNLDEEQRSIPELILQHRHNLRVQSRNMKMPKSRLISDIYTEPRITVTHTEHGHVSEESNNHVGEVEIHELLKRRNSDTDKTNIIVVYGAAGTGKTTLIQKIIHDWAKGMIYEEFRFVLHLNVQHLNAIKGGITLSGLIVDTYPYLENYQDQLWKKPEGILFIFDDLNHLEPAISFSDDERNSDPGHRCTGPEPICFGHDILRCLLQGEVLKGCTVLITARHWEQATLRHLRVDATFQMMDFTSENVKKYFCSYLANDQYANRIVQFIEQNDILRNMCSNPLFCVTLAFSLESHQPQREEQATMPNISHTQVLFDYVVHLLRACGYDHRTTLRCLLEVGKLAYKGITHKTLPFEASVLRELNQCSPNFTSAFMIPERDKQNGSLVYEFRHSVIRDFLAAVAKLLDTPIAQLKVLLDQQFTDTIGRFRTFSLFLVGLSSQKSIDRLKLQLGSDRSEVHSCISQWLRESVKRRLIHMEQRMVLHTLYSLLEFGDSQVLEEVLAPTTTIKLNQIRLTSPDCTVLSRTLIYSEMIEELDLSSCFAQPEEIQKLEPMLHRCVILRLNQNKLQDSGVKRILKSLEKVDCKIQTLELKSNHLTDDCLHALFSVLRTNRSLTLLDLSNFSQNGQHDNRFTSASLKQHVVNYAQQKEIRWLRYGHTGLDNTSNVFTLITE